jgi:C1A family cysteine protease
MSTLFIISILLFLASFSYAMDISTIDYKYIKSSAWRTEEEVKDIYELWIEEHDKVYNSLVEYEKRFEIFKDNLKFIDEHNSENHTYKVGLTPFADLTNEEFQAMYLGTKSDPMYRLMRSKNVSQRYAFKVGDNLPASVDWRTKGAVNPIKNQGKCGEFFCLSLLLIQQCTVEISFKFSFRDIFISQYFRSSSS